MRMPANKGSMSLFMRFPERYSDLAGERIMPTKKTIKKAKEDKREGKAPSTQAGEFIREEMHKVRGGEHGVRSPQQAIAIGLSEARRAGVDLPPPGKGKAKARTRRSAKYAYEV